MHACHNCGESLFHPNDGHTVICPSCGLMFDFKNPQTLPPLSNTKTTLPAAPLKQRARWMAVLAIIVLCAIYYYQYAYPSPEPQNTEQNP